MIIGQSLSGIDPTFDYVVSLLAPKNVRLTSRQYADFAEMKADFERTGYIYVNVDHSDNTIFGSPSTNWQFRAWHDMCHIQADADFSFEGEQKAAELQMTQVATLHGPTYKDKTRWLSLIRAEVIGQGEYYREHGDFPNDQRAFVADYIAHTYNVDVTTFPKTLDGVVVQY